MNFVLLTAAVTPNAQIQTALSDAELRLSQYQQALAFWATQCTEIGWKTILVETTGCPHEKLVKNLPTPVVDAVDVITYESLDGEARNGKGAIEAAAMDYAVQNTRFDLNGQSALYKVTGRLTLGNARRLLKGPGSNAAIVRRSLDRRYCDTRFFGTTVKFWRDHLLEMASEVNDAEGRYLEHVFAHRLSDAEYRSNAHVTPFAQRPLIGGQSGTTGAKYGQGPSLGRDLILRPVEKLLHKHLSRKQA